MARYYERETLIEFVKKYTPTINGETTMKCVERAIREAPTADVVPKSEVEEWKEIAEAYQKQYEEHCGKLIEERDALVVKLKQAKAEVAREIFEEIERLLAIYSYTDEYGKEVIGVDVEEPIAELKKKYTGETE